MQITEQKNIILIKECKDVKTVSVTKETNENVNYMNITLVLDGMLNMVCCMMQFDIPQLRIML